MSETVAWRGAVPAAPLVVLLHGRGSDEVDGLTLADGLPEGPAYAAPRAPLAMEGGYGWFERAGVGRPEPASLREQLDRYRAWIDEVAPAGRSVTVIGFSMGAVFAAALALDDPARYAGVGVLYGAVPFDAGVPTTPGRLAGANLFHAQATGDHTFPDELMERTWRYLSKDAGADAVTHRHPGVHEVTPAVVESLAFWVAKVLAVRD